MEIIFVDTSPLFITKFPSLYNKFAEDADVILFTFQIQSFVYIYIYIYYLLDKSTENNRFH